MVILLDPRSLLPLDVNVEKAFEDSGAAGTVCHGASSRHDMKDRIRTGRGTGVLTHSQASESSVFGADVAPMIDGAPQQIPNDTLW